MVVSNSFGSSTMETVQVDLIYPSHVYIIVILICQLYPDGRCSYRLHAWHRIISQISAVLGPEPKDGRQVCSGYPPLSGSTPFAYRSSKWNGHGTLIDVNYAKNSITNLIKDVFSVEGQIFVINTLYLHWKWYWYNAKKIISPIIGETSARIRSPS